MSVETLIRLKCDRCGVLSFPFVDEWAARNELIQIHPFGWTFLPEHGDEIARDENGNLVVVGHIFQVRAGVQCIDRCAECSKVFIGIVRGGDHTHG